MGFWRCYYHIIWATKGREPSITVHAEQLLFEAIKQKSQDLRAPVLGINAVSDHLHVAVTIPPTVAIVDWVRHVKGVSSREVNTALPNTSTRFRWQSGYGVLTFGAKNLPMVLDYITRQKEHHRDGTIQPYLEQTDDSE